MHGSIRPRFQFRTFTDDTELDRSDSLTFDDMDELWHEGAMTACEIVRGMHGRIEDDLNWRLEVADDTGKIIYRFSFKAERLT